MLRKMKWENIYLVSPTAEQHTFDPIRKVFTRTFKHGASGIFDRITGLCEKRRDERSLLIVDDCAADHGTNTGRKGGFANIANNARWINLSVIVITQNLSSISPSMRDNAEAIIFFRSLNVNEKEYLLRERNPYRTKGEMESVLAQAVGDGDPRSFLLQIITYRAVYHFKGLDHFLSTDNDITIRGES